MKKLFAAIAVLFLLNASNVFSQEDEWERIRDIEEYFLLFEVEVEVWYNQETMILNFEDYISTDFGDMIYQWSYLMQAFEFMLDDSGLEFQNVDVKTIIYSFFVIVDKLAEKDKEPNIRYDIHMEYNWLIDFFGKSRKQRDNMIIDLFESHYQKWIPQKQVY